MMGSEPSQPVAPGFFRFGVADFVFVFFALSILQRAGGGMVDDPGLGWQIRIPDAMIEHGGFVYTDPFGGPTQGEPWVPYGFLGSSLYRLADEWSGLDGIAALTAFTLALLLRCLYRMLVTDGVPTVQALLWTFLAALGISSAWVARPNVFTLLFTLVTAHVCVQWHRGQISRNRTLWLIPLFLVWANTHGGFAGGLITIAVAGLAELAIARFNPGGRSEAIARFRWFVMLGAGCFLATLVNPYGWRLHALILKVMRDPFMMNLNDDWLSPDFHAVGAFRFELLILLLPLLLACSRYRPDWVSLALVIVWLHFALNGRRFAPLWVLVAVPTMALLTKELPVMERIGAWLRESHPDFAPRPPAPAGRLRWFWTAVIALALLISTRYVGAYARHNPEIIPAQALDRLLELHRGERVFHSINWGGYLTWKGWKNEPHFLVWIDDRNEIYGKARTEEWRTLSAALPGWREKLDDLGIELVCIEANSGLAYRLAEEPHRWEELYRDDYAVIFRRKG